jgi:hypothetical protein
LSRFLDGRWHSRGIEVHTFVTGAALRTATPDAGPFRSGATAAGTADEAIDAAAVEFNVDAWKFIAVPRYAIA